MIGAASGLLSLLGGASTENRSAGSAKGAGSAASGAALADQPLDFAALLDKARAGEIHSGRRVTVAKGANIRFSEDQLQRLAAAADLAESQGATRAVALIDGHAVRLDISMREVTESLDLASPAVLTNVDAVISIPATSAQSGTKAAITPLPGNGMNLSNASLLSALAQSEDKADEEVH